MSAVRVIGMVVILFATIASVGANAQGTEELRGFQCMSLVHLWTGVGPMPLSVWEYSGPGPDASRVGIAVATLIVDRPIKVAGGRVRVIRPNGQVAWIDSSEIVPWHVVSKPNARCTVVQMANGNVGVMLQ